MRSKESRGILSKAGQAPRESGSTRSFADVRNCALDSLSIVIPSHNRVDRLRDCLKSVTRHAPAGTEILVVDDASPGGIIFTAATEFAQVRALRLPIHSGFCAAANVGIANTHNPIVEMLNDDTEVCAGWAQAGLACFDDPSIGAVAPLVLQWPGGDTRESRIDSAGDRYSVGGVAGKRGHGRALSATYLRRTRVFGASASSAFYRRSALNQAGGFPESFKAYFEDIDLAFRLHWSGFDILYEPASRVLHHVGSSYGKPADELLEQQSCNEERVFWRNLPGRLLLRSLPAHAAVIAAKAWRRWRAGELNPFLRGRFRALRELSSMSRSSIGNQPSFRALARWRLDHRMWPE
jgi:GT2 family glycosyltransferase